MSEREPLAGTTFTIESNAGPAAFDALRAEWEALWARTPGAGEAQAWRWQDLYVRHLLDAKSPILVTVRHESGRLAALASFQRRRDRVSGLLTESFLGEHDVDYHAALAEEGLPVEVGTRMFEWFVARRRRGVSFIELNNVPSGSWTANALAPHGQALAARDPRVKHWESDTYSVGLPGTIEAYLETLGPSTRSKWSYNRRRLAKDHEVAFRVGRTPGDVSEMIDAVDALDRARWGPTSRYARPAEQSFQRAVAAAMAEMGLYRVFLLSLGGRPAAYIAGTLVDGAFRVPHVAYDPSVPAKYSVGQVSHFMAIEHAISEGWREYDLTRGGETYKQWLGGRRRGSDNYRFYRSALDQRAERATTAALAAVKARPGLWAAVRRLRG